MDQPSMQIAPTTHRGQPVWELSQTGGREVIPWPVIYVKARQAENYARWRIEETGGAITVLDGAEPPVCRAGTGRRVVTLPRGNSWLSPRG